MPQQSRQSTYPTVQISGAGSDSNGNGRADSGEIRLFDTGDGFEVECASCHDPHSVRPDGVNRIPSFLRVTNGNASALCQTCHNK